MVNTWKDLRISDWLAYNTLTAIAVAVLCILQQMSGAYIRWEVGPVASVVSQDPYTSLAPGWNSVHCEDTMINGKPVKACAFSRN